MTHEPEIECPTCNGDGVVQHPHLQGAYISSHAESPPDPVMVDCEECNGNGYRAMTDDEASDAAERQYHDRCEGEPPMSADEMHQRAWQQKRELRRG